MLKSAAVAKEHCFDHINRYVGSQLKMQCNNRCNNTCWLLLLQTVGDIGNSRESDELVRDTGCHEAVVSEKEQEIKSATTYKSNDDSNIDDKEQVRDLGIMMSNTSTFTLYIRNTVKKARDKMGWVLRVFQSRKRSLMLALLKSLVIPLLEYCCQLWNPWTAKTYKLSKLFNERLHTKSLTYST